MKNLLYKKLAMLIIVPILSIMFTSVGFAATQGAAADFSGQLSNVVSLSQPPGCSPICNPNTTVGEGAIRTRFSTSHCGGWAYRWLETWVRCPRCNRTWGHANASPHEHNTQGHDNELIPAGNGFRLRCRRCGHLGPIMLSLPINLE